MAKVKSTTEIEFDEQNKVVRKIVIHNDNLMKYWKKRCEDYLKIKRFAWHVELPLETEFSAAIKKQTTKSVWVCENMLNHYMHVVSTEIERYLESDRKGDKKAKKDAERLVKMADKLVKKYPRMFAKTMRVRLNAASRGKVGRSVSSSGFFGMKLVEDIFHASDNDDKKDKKDTKGKDDKKKDDKKTK